jgi:ferric-dicitrate binding protein FerR (iron transport regulator)
VKSGNDMTRHRINYLLDQHVAGKATAEEQAEFLSIIRDAADDDLIRESLAQSWQEFATTDEIPREKADTVFHSILQQAAGLHRRPARILFMTVWKRMAVAAVLILLLGVGGYFFFNRPSQPPPAGKTAVPAGDIVTSGSAHAILTLAGGKRIVLDSAGNGRLAIQGNMQVVRLADGRIAYDAGGNVLAGNTAFYNTLTVPRGSKVASLVLSDGTRVWLNAASSITYPTTFTGKDRSVQLEGEAYLEIAKDKNKPFRITAEGCSIEVLGTHFNVNAYSDEPVLRTTLLEGSVSITKGSDKKILSPGQQAVVKDKILLDDHVDLDQVIAWKTGIFNFNRITLKEAMRQLSRWYDVDVEYPSGLADKKFGGEMGRDLTLTQVLRLLNGMDMHFKLEGRKVIAFP